MKNKKRKGERKFRFLWSTAVFWLILIARMPSVEMVLTLGSALLHEIGHLTAARLTHVPIAAVTVYPFGADIRLAPGLRSYRTDALIALAGAAANLLLAGVGALIGGAAGLFLTPCNLTLACLNLLPIDGLDGGVLLRTCLESQGMESDGVARIVSFCCLLALWLGAVYVLWIEDGDPSFFVLSCGLFAVLFSGEKKRKVSGEKRGNRRIREIFRDYLEKIPNNHG